MIEEIRRQTASARCTRWSIAYNVIFVINLATTPFMAYLTEPRPGEVQVNLMPLWDTFEDFVNVTTAYFRQIHNSQTMGTLVSRRDTATNTFGIRRDLTIPYSVSEDEAFRLLIDMPAAVFYGSGVRTYVLTFFTANETTRNQMQPWQICQHERYMSMTWLEFCLWIEETAPTQYTAWGVTYINEGHPSMWSKFTFRCILSMYVVRVLWKRYYRHYIILLSNLRHVGIAQRYVRYEIVVGDPAYAILSDPLVSFCMVVDIWWNVDYISFAFMRVTQFQDIWLYISGCMYLSRYVWFAYLGLRIMSFVVKRRRWESLFAPMDPGLLAIGAYIYAGPIISVLGTTKMAWIFYFMWPFFLPPEMSEQAVEAITVVSFVSVLMMTLPVIASRLFMIWENRIDLKLVDKVHPTGSTSSFSNYTYNDMKAYLLLSLTMKKQSRRTSGGSVYKLYQESLRYKKIALSSHKAADCFVLCYNSDGCLEQQIRLSLLPYLNPQLDDPEFAIPTCSSCHKTSVSIISSEGCPTFTPTSKRDKCIHRGENNCQWIM
ncbi:hypothetical protein AeMF1_012830 [Aphanomyces euteiches]|nr:hypothetical protein AeMF1_012830 [Aphanomyces euteiches]